MMECLNVKIKVLKYEVFRFAPTIPVTGLSQTENEFQYRSHGSGSW